MKENQKNINSLSSDKSNQHSFKATYKFLLEFNKKEKRDVKEEAPIIEEKKDDKVENKQLGSDDELNTVLWEVFGIKI